MFLQRLVLDTKIGFNYDYMGAAEYEFGATREGRSALGRAFLDGDISATTTRFVERHGVTVRAPIDVVIMGRRARLAEIGEEWAVSTSKEAFRTNDEKIVGWMHVGHSAPEPLLIIRASLADASQRVDVFMKPCIEFLEELAHTPA